MLSTLGLRAHLREIEDCLFTGVDFYAMGLDVVELLHPPLYHGAPFDSVRRGGGADHLSFLERTRRFPEPGADGPRARHGPPGSGTRYKSI